MSARPATVETANRQQISLGLPGSGRGLKLPGAISFWTLVTLALATRLSASAGWAGPATPQQNEFFEKSVRPVLAGKCFECHGPEKQKADLRLDSRAAVLQGSDVGPVVIAGKPEESPLIKAIRHLGDVKMPKRKPKLSDTQIAALAQWVAMGLPWPEYDKAMATNSREARDSEPKLRSRNFAITEEDRAWWSFQPIRRPDVPPVRQTADVANPIDSFLLARLESKNLGFSPLASKRELVRRAYFDLLGLPPTPEVVETFERNDAPGAWEKLVDDLLSWPQYGERWARHWLDVVRYAESNGYERDGAKPNAWRYRDYVIKAFNDDKPYDRFILEQLAGDELEDTFNEDAIIATGFYRLHVWDDEPDSTVAAEFDDLDDIMVTTGAAFLGLTIGCARCHDHKFDPFTQAEYYQMLSLVRNISPYGLHKIGGGSRGTGRITRPLAEHRIVAAWEAEKEARLAPLREQLAAEKDAEKKKKLEAEMQRVEDEAPFGYALAINEDPIKPTYLLRRGDANSPGPEVEPAFPAIFGNAEPVIATSVSSDSSGRRLALARWIARPQNPLTARVLANRLWQHHFGRGLVPTPNDFGRTGLKPSHPDLLDYLASEFVAGGWKLKRMHKLIMMSRAYRMSSRANHQSGRADDEANDLLWRQNPRRAEAEVLRDTVLAVSGALNLKMAGPSIFPSLPKEVHRTQDSEGKGWKESSPHEQNRRSIYIFVKRALIPPILETFDYTATTVPVGERAVTTVAPQALMLLNDSFIQEQGMRLAKRLRQEAGYDRAAQVKRAFALALQRPPTEREKEASLAMLDDQRRLASGPDAEQTALRNFCVAMFNLNEFIYVD